MCGKELKLLKRGGALFTSLLKSPTIWSTSIAGTAYDDFSFCTDTVRTYKYTLLSALFFLLVQSSSRVHRSIFTSRYSPLVCTYLTAYIPTSYTLEVRPESSLLTSVGDFSVHVFTGPTPIYYFFVRSLSSPWETRIEMNFFIGWHEYTKYVRNVFAADEFARKLIYIFRKKIDIFHAATKK